MCAQSWHCSVPALTRPCSELSIQKQSVVLELGLHGALVPLCLELLTAFPSALPSQGCQCQHNPRMKAGSVVPSLLGDRIKLKLALLGPEAVF